MGNTQTKKVDDIFNNLLTGNIHSESPVTPPRPTFDSNRIMGGADNFDINTDDIITPTKNKSESLNLESLDLNSESDNINKNLTSTDTLEKLKRNFYESPAKKHEEKEDSSDSHGSPLQVSSTKATSDLIYSTHSNDLNRNLDDSPDNSDNEDFNGELDTDKIGEQIFDKNMSKFEQEDNKSDFVSDVQSDDEIAAIKRQFKKNDKYL